MNCYPAARGRKAMFTAGAVAILATGFAAQVLWRATPADAAAQTCVDASREALSSSGYQVRLSKVRPLRAGGQMGYISVSVSERTPADRELMLVLTCSDDGTTARSERYRLLDPADGMPPILTLEQQTGHDAAGQTVSAIATLPLTLDAAEAAMVRRENARAGFVETDVPSLGRVSARLVPSDKLTALAVEVLRKSSDAALIEADGALTLPASLAP